VHLAVVGDGELRAELEQQARELDLTDRVHFTGWILDVAAVYRDVDAVVLSSRNEGTPVALIEAAAAGRPVVATDVGGVRAVVDDGITGLLAPAGEPHALAQRVRAVVADPGLGSRMGRAGRRKVGDRFGLERLLADMRQLYDELLA
jgi:glycosyltransferase involved in cell wall biosynthesis